MLQGSYEENVNAKIDLVKTRSEEFRRIAVACAQSVGVETLQIARQIRLISDQSFTLGTMSLAKVEDIHEQSSKTFKSIQEVAQDMSAMKAKTGTRSVLEDDMKAFRSLASQSDCK